MLKMLPRCRVAKIVLASTACMCHTLLNSNEGLPEMKTFKAYDPKGDEHVIHTSRPVAFAIFLEAADGRFYSHFAKTERQARAHWGSRGINLVRAFEIQGEEA